MDIVAGKGPRPAFGILLSIELVLAREGYRLPVNRPVVALNRIAVGTGGSHFPYADVNMRDTLPSTQLSKDRSLWECGSRFRGARRVNRQRPIEMSKGHTKFLFAIVINLEKVVAIRVWSGVFIRDICRGDGVTAYSETAASLAYIEGVLIVRAIYV
jgi:hypothetical protein